MTDLLRNLQDLLRRLRLWWHSYRLSRALKTGAAQRGRTE